MQEHSVFYILMENLWSAFQMLSSIKKFCFPDQKFNFIQNLDSTDFEKEIEFSSWIEHSDFL